MNRVPFVSALLAVATPFAHAQQPTWLLSQQGPVAGYHYAAPPELAPNGDVFGAFTSTAAGGTPTQPNFDAVVVRLDTAGNQLWARALDLGGDEYVTTVLHDDAQGALYVVGGVSRNSTLPQRPWVLWKLNASTGQVVWMRTHPTASADASARGATLDGLGGIVVYGATYPGGSFYPDAAAARFAPDGSVVWSRAITTGGPEYFSSIASAGQGSVVLTLAIGDTGSSVHRIDAAGTETWSFVYPGRAGEVQVDSAGAIVLNAAPTGSPARIEKRDAQGALLWTRDFESLGFGSSSGGSVRVGPGDQLHVSNGWTGVTRLAPGGSELWTSFVPGVEHPFVGTLASVRAAANGDSIVFSEGTASEKEFVSVARFDSAGNYLWTRAITGDLTDVIRPNRSGVRGLADGTVVLSGQLGQTPSYAASRAFLARLADSSSRFCFGDGSSGSCPCGNNTAVGAERGCSLFTGPSGMGARLDDSGSPSLTSDSLRFDAFLSIASYGGFALLVDSSSIGSGAPLHDGLLCLSGAIHRVSRGTLTLGNGTFPPVGTPSVSARAALAGAPIAPGSTRHYQVYYRSTGSVCGGAAANLTNGVSVTWSP